MLGPGGHQEELDAEDGEEDAQRGQLLEVGEGEAAAPRPGDGVLLSAVKRSIGSTTGCTITEKAPTRAFSWLKAPTSAFTFKTLLRHYARRALTPRSLNVKLGPRRNYHKGRAAIRHYANQTARLL